MVRLDQSDYEESVFEIRLDGDDNPTEMLFVRHTCPAFEVIPRIGAGFAQALRMLDTHDEYDEDHGFTWQDVRWENSILLDHEWRPIVPIDGILSVRLGLENWIGEVDCYDPLVPASARMIEP